MPASNPEEWTSEEYICALAMLAVAAQETKGPDVAIEIIITTMGYQFRDDRALGIRIAPIAQRVRQLMFKAIAQYQKEMT